MILLTTVLSSIAQDTIPVSVLSSGQGTPSDEATTIYSLVGQDAVGVSANDSLKVRSGYFGFPIVQTAIINDPPVITSISIDTAYKGQYYQYKAVATDPDNKSIILSYQNLPYGFVGQGDSVISFNVLQSSDTSFTVIASDGTLFDTLTVTVVVSLQVKPFKITSPALDTAIEDEKFIYIPTSSFDNDTDVTIEYDYRYSFHPSWLSPVVGANNKTTLVGTPLEGDTSTSFIVKAIDKADSTTPLDMKEVKLSVLAVNDAPELTLPTSLSAIATQEFQYQIDVQDVDDSILTFSLLKGPAGMNVNDAGLLSGWTPPDSLVGTVDTVKIRVRDPLSGADSGTFAVRVVAEGTPYCSNVGPIDSVARDSITIPYTLVDMNFDILSMSVKYYFPDGSSAAPTTLIGKTTGIDSSGYTGSFTWASRDDFSDTLIDSVLIEIIPSDTANTGPPFRTGWFAINNTAALTVGAVTPLTTDTVTGYYGRNISITFAGQQVDTSSLDHTTVLISGSVGGAMGYTITKSANGVQCVLNEFPIGSETVTVTVSGAVKDINNKTLDGDGDGLFEGAGIDDYFASFTITKLGDFDGNNTIGGAVELSHLSTYWNGSMAGTISADSIFKVELGPATGTPPYLKVTPDSSFNFDDLCVYLQMWYWDTQFDNAIVRGPLAKKAPLPTQYKQSSQGSEICVPDASGSNYDQEKAVQRVTVRHESNNKLYLCMDVKSISKLVACEYRIYYDKSQLTYVEPVEASMLKDEFGDALVLDDSREGFVNISMVRLSSSDLSVSGDGTITSLLFQKQGNLDAITIEYTLVNQNHEIIESDLIPLTSKELNQEDEQDIEPVAKLNVYPNPFKTSVMPGILEVTDNISLLMNRAAQGGGTVITFAVADNSDIAISIFDPLGNTIIKIPTTKIFPKSGTKADGQQFGIYWNGTNRNNRRVEPGVYKVVVYWKTDELSGVRTALIGVKER